MTTPLNILVTGATSGIGRETALYLARQGHRVFATGRNAKALADLEQAAKGSDLRVHALDVTDETSIEAARAWVSLSTDGYGLDALVNNAGYGHLGPMELVTSEQLRAQFETNVIGVMAVTRAFLPAMRSRGKGRIVNVSSVAGRLTMPLMGAYEASKYALESISDALRMELAPFGVQVVIVEPGLINTEFGTRGMATTHGYRGNPGVYGPLLETANDTLTRSEMFGGRPIVIAHAIERAVTARWPRARYVAPLHGRLALFAKAVLPTWVMDLAMRQAMGLTRRKLVADVKIPVLAA